MHKSKKNESRRMTDFDPRFHVGTAEALRILGCTSRQTLYNLERSNKIKAVHNNRHVYYRRLELERIAAGKVGKRNRPVQKTPQPFFPVSPEEKLAQFIVRLDAVERSLQLVLGTAAPGELPALLEAYRGVEGTVELHRTVLKGLAGIRSGDITRLEARKLLILFLQAHEATLDSLERAVGPNAYHDVSCLLMALCRWCRAQSLTNPNDNDLQQLAALGDDVLVRWRESVLVFLLVQLSPAEQIRKVISQIRIGADAIDEEQVLRGMIRRHREANHDPV